MAMRLQRVFALAAFGIGLAACSSSGGSGTPGSSLPTSVAPLSATARVPAPSSTASGFPTGFWDTTNIPPAKNVMTFKFLNRTNGKYPDTQVFWSVKINGVTTTHSLAQQNTFDMPANSAGRMYFYLGKVGTTSTNYYDFIEYTISATTFNGNTTRVDAFGLKLAMLLHCADGFETIVGENYPTFAEDRSVTFQRYINAVPDPFKQLGRINAPYRIPSPGRPGGFGAGGANANYYAAYIAQVWKDNALVIPTPGPNAGGLGAYPSLSAAIMRHTAGPHTFTPQGKLISQSMWANPATFYQSAPADYYAKFWHDSAVSGKAYGFPYDDVGGYSSFISHAKPQYLVVAIGY